MRAERVDFYRRYLERCNEHRFDELDVFVDVNVRINGLPAGVEEYGAGLQSVVEAFPDLHWELQHLLVDGDWLSAHLVDTGTHRGPFLGVPPTGRAITVQEFAVYELSGGKIVNCWGNLDTAIQAELTRG
jgi:predicted ester cyclase